MANELIVEFVSFWLATMLYQFTREILARYTDKNPRKIYRKRQEFSPNVLKMIKFVKIPYFSHVFLSMHISLLYRMFSLFEYCPEDASIYNVRQFRLECELYAFIKGEKNQNKLMAN